MAVEADAAGVRAVYAPIVESSATSFELAVPSIAEMGARITTRQPAHPWLVVEDASGVQGYAYAGRFSGRPAYDWSVETSVYLADTARGRGIGKALYTALFEVLAAQGYRQAMAGISLPNAASVALHEGLGFSPVGVYRAVGWKFAAWHDVGWWQRRLGGSDGPPRGPLALTALAPDTLDVALMAGRALLGAPPR
jgi:phosphinothricin acetyltransferase